VPASIRTAVPADVPAIAAAYGIAVRESVATFDVTDPPDDYWLDRILSPTRGDHVLAVEDAGEVVGFAYSAPFRPRPAYAATRETSIYLQPGATGRGLGRQAYEQLLAALRSDGVHCAVAVIAQPNPASVSLHRSFGFELEGTLREVGRKFDRWVDTAWYQLLLH